MRLELLPISLLKSCPFFWACPLVQEEAIPDRKLKYFSSKNPATSACFWRFLGSTGSTRNGAGAGCRARSYESRPPSGVRANGKQPATSPQLPPLLHPSSLVRPVRPEKPPHSPRLWEKAGKAGKEPRPSAGPKKWPSSTSSRTEEQWSGKLVKRFFSPAYSSICWPGTGPTRRQADNQESSYPSLVILTFSNSLRPRNPRPG